MREKPVFFYHSLSISALFFISGGIIGLPFHNGNDLTLAAYLITGALSVLLYLVAIPIANNVFAKNSNSVYKKFLTIIFCSITAIYSLFCMAFTFKEFVIFASKMLLPEFPLYISVLIFAVVCIIFIYSRQESVLKFSLLAFIFVSFLVIFFFLAMWNKFDIQNIIIYRFPDFKELYTQTKPYLIRVILPSLLLPVYQAFSFGKCGKHSAFWGIISGFVMLGLCIFSSVLLFTPQLAGRLDYPYASAVSTITAGRLFTRLDGFSYFIYFATSLIRVVTCIFISFSCLKKISKALTKAKIDAKISLQ